jgi:predicted nuclease with TOPRIM domain
MNAIQKNSFFDENDMREINDIKRQMVVELQEKVDDLMEEKRQLLVEIQKLKNGDSDGKT